MNTETIPDRLEPMYRERKHVRWDPTINMGHIITAVTTTVMSLVFVMTSYAAMDKRVVVLEEARISQREKEAERAETLKERIGEVKDAIRETKESVELLRRDIQSKK